MKTGVKTAIGSHSSQAPAIANYLENGATLENSPARAKVRKSQHHFRTDKVERCVNYQKRP